MELRPKLKSKIADQIAKIINEVSAGISVQNVSTINAAVRVFMTSNKFEGLQEFLKDVFVEKQLFDVCANYAEHAEEATLFVYLLFVAEREVTFFGDDEPLEPTADEIEKMDNEVREDYEDERDKQKKRFELMEALVVRCFRRDFAHLLWPLSLAMVHLEGTMSGRLCVWFYALFAYGVNLEPELKLRTLQQTMPYLLDSIGPKPILGLLQACEKN